MVRLAEVVSAGVDDDGSLSGACQRDGRKWTAERELTPMTLSGPMSLTSLSVTEPFALPWPSVLMLPKSPTWRSWSDGAPWSLLNGLTIKRR